MSKRPNRPVKPALVRAARAASELLESRRLLAEVAENLLVDVDATTLPEGAATSVPNTGTLGGFFEPRGGGDTVPVIGRPLAAATVGTQGIRLDGNDFLQLAQTAGGNLQLAPAGLTGTDPTRSIEVWAWNPAVAPEETMVAWGKRGGPAGTNMSFNYGSDNRWGAVGHWGDPDLGWGPTADDAPAARLWHHLAYTYDGTTTRVYEDGVLVNSETLGAGVINTHPDTPINIGTQTETDGFTPTGALRGSLTIGKVRVHDGVLSDAQVAANYNAERDSFVEPDNPPPPPPPPPVKLVDVDATNLPEGPAALLPNAGTMGGFFQSTGGGDTVPVVGRPLEGSTTGTRGIRLDGNDYLQHVESENGALLPAPAGVVGLNPTRSIEVWAWNPAVAAEETMVAWGRRGGPDGTNMSFNYGSHNQWGAAGHWGQPHDAGWGPPAEAAAPAAGTWHHLVYTYDGTTTRLYADGTLLYAEELGEGLINTHAGTPINIGTQIDGNGFTPTGTLRGSLTLGRVRVYDGVLTAETVAANYDAEKSNYVEPDLPPPPTPTPLAAPPAHRYSFNEPAGDASGDQIIDSIGDAHGTVVGPLEGSAAGAPAWSGTRLVLPGGPSTEAPYGNLPNQLLSKFGVFNGGPGQVSIEGWVRHTAGQNWSRFFDFGSGTAGELETPGGTANGTSYLFLSAQVGGDTATHRFELFANPNNPNNRTADVPSTTFGTDLHFVATWDEATGRLKLYEQGTEVAAFSSPALMSDIFDVNNWLGRSNYTADANFQGEYDEFRVYGHVLSPGEVLGNFQAGADVVTGGLPRVTRVFVNSTGNTGWSPAFRQAAGDATFGFPVDAASQLDELPWSNINQVSIRFSGDVDVDQNDLAIRGVNRAAYPTGAFSYDPVTFTATWTLADGPDADTLPDVIANDKVLLDLDGSNSDADGNNDAVDDDPSAAVGNLLDGEWANGSPSQNFPSGDGTAGGDFRFQVNVLPGDVNRSGGGVNSIDLQQVRNRQFTSTTSQGTPPNNDYTVFHDVNGSGNINSIDLQLVRNNQFKALPAANPTLVAGSTSFASLSWRGEEDEEPRRTAEAVLK